MENKLRILLADDEALLRLDLRELITDAGHQIVGEAADGEQAVKLARELRPDFIIMDVKMPIMDGLTAAKLIDEENIAPVLLLTAYSQEDIVSKAADSGIIAYLVKPVREDNFFPLWRSPCVAFGKGGSWRKNWMSCGRIWPLANW